MSFICYIYFIPSNLGIKRALFDSLIHYISATARAKKKLFGNHIFNERASLVAQTVKCLPTMQETRVQSLAREDPLEKELATSSRILARRIPWTEEPGGLRLGSLKESDTTE